MKAPLSTVPNFLSIESWRIPSYLENQKWRNGASLVWTGFLFICCIVLFAAGAAIVPAFASARNMSYFLKQGHYLALIAMGAVFVFANGGVDLSVGAMAGLCGFVCGSLANSGMPLPAAIAVALALSIALGAVNGSLVAAFRAPSFLVTLGAGFILKPFVTLGTGGTTSPVRFPDGPVSAFFWIAFVAVFALAILFVQLPGWNARKRIEPSGEGIGSRLLRLGLPFAMSAFMAGAAGIVMTARLAAVVPALGTGFELQAIFLVLVGGCVFGARYGNPLGVIVAVLFATMLTNLFSILGIDVASSNFIAGAIYVAIIGIRFAFDLVVSSMYRGRSGASAA